MTIDIPPMPLDDTRKRLIAAFMNEVTAVLDESVPFPKRLAIARKWSYTLYGLGVLPRPLDEDVDAAELAEKAREMLMKLQELVKSLKGG